MVGGQADDLAAEHAAGNLQHLEQIHRRKTGAMLVVSLRLGAITAQANCELLDRLTAYGTRLGLAFQIVDDLLDQTGNVNDIGKKDGSGFPSRETDIPVAPGSGRKSRRRADQLDWRRD